MKTERLLLRSWKHEDFEFFARLNSDPEVMEYYPKLLSMEESDLLAQKFRTEVSSQGWGPWAVELKSLGQFIGVVGLQKTEFGLPFAPCVEVAWRLDKAHWGKGYATEAAIASLEYASRVLKLKQVVSFTSLINTRSQSVMKKIGMYTDGYEFDHPKVPEDSKLCRHVLYKIDFNH